MPADRRARMRDLMYQMIDTHAAGRDASTLESLKAAGMVGNAEAALELAQLLGEEIAGNLIRFIQALLTRVAAALLALLAEVIADIQRAVEAWMQSDRGPGRGRSGTLADLLREINALQARSTTPSTSCWPRLGPARRLRRASRQPQHPPRQDQGRRQDRALDVLADFPGYGALPRDMRRGIRAHRAQRRRRRARR